MTELRTKSPELVNFLQKGISVSLIHRSHVIGVIQPTPVTTAPPITPAKFRAFLKQIKPRRPLSDMQREHNYRRHLEDKYGKNIS